MEETSGKQARGLGLLPSLLCTCFLLLERRELISEELYYSSFPFSPTGNEMKAFTMTFHVLPAPTVCLAQCTVEIKTVVALGTVARPPVFASSTTCSTGSALLAEAQ